MSDTEHKLPRRRVLEGGMGIAGLAATAGMPFWSRFALAQGEEIVPFTDMPAESVADTMPNGVHWLDTRMIDDFYTSNDDFYVVHHYNTPQLSAADHRLRISGLVQRPTELSLADLMAMPRSEIDAGFECGGNNRIRFHGLIGNARWGGVSLRSLLSEAGVRREGIEVVFYGADTGMENVRDLDIEQAFGRSMTFTDAMSSDAILAWEMNGEPLPHMHGAPLRLVVPGWYGVANVKWLSQIHVQDRRFMGRFMARDYVTLSRREVGGLERWEERSVTRMQLKSSIVRVTRRRNRYNIRGFVLNDGTPLQAVEVSIDGGPWQAAQIDSQSSRYSWKLFDLEWRDPAPGEHTLVSRAIDVNGQVQATPEELPQKPTRWENYAQFTRTVQV
ncbi:MAG TPA: sulfite oxidase [Gammaproteobacteria bacterium]|jgi:DMSO/TMAO reductase YedYZ molybdopterin-dependent catalytic subunit|nr:sulfite oxidase [Gammaproteobacteria bacterium]